LGRIENAFKELQREGKKGFIPFVTAGDPNLQATGELLVELAQAGATIIELGVPFSDPMADGPVIQRASERALKHGFGMQDVLEVAGSAREKIATPIILFTYFNPLLQFGLQRLAIAAKRAGIDGVLVTDLIPEEAGDFASEMRANELDLIFLVAPTSTDTRLKLIAEHASGFIYAVSRAGITGERSTLRNEAERLVNRVRGFTRLPVAVGFSITNKSQAADVHRYADAVVVGSAIVAEIERLGAARDLVKRVGQLARDLISS